MIVNSKLNGETKIKLTKRETATLGMAKQLCRQIVRATDGDANKHASGAGSSIEQLMDVLGVASEQKVEDKQE